MMVKENPWQDRKVVLVFHACGKFGYDIPWADWMNWTVYPTCEHDRPYTTILSFEGQEDPEQLASMRKNAIGRSYINVDNWLMGGVVDWDLVLAEINKVGTRVPIR